MHRKPESIGAILRKMFSYKELTDYKSIRNILSTKKPEAEECDESGMMIEESFIQKWGLCSLSA